MTPIWVRNVIVGWSLTLLLIILFLLTWYLHPSNSNVTPAQLRTKIEVTGSSILVDNHNLGRTKRQAFRTYNPCNTVHVNRKIKALHICYNNPVIASTVMIPFASVRTRDDESAALYAKNEWYMATTKGSSTWGSAFTYTGTEWDPKDSLTTPEAQQWYETLTLSKTLTHLILTFNTTKNPLPPTPPLLFTYASQQCYHFILFAYTSGQDPGVYFSLCTNITANESSHCEECGLTRSPALDSSIYVEIHNQQLQSDDWFKVTTGISALSNNWLLLVENAAKTIQHDCVVCLGPRPVLKVIPAIPISLLIQRKSRTSVKVCGHSKATC
ncbi:uncharacterized protein LOC106524948 [Austrofundulus limnaeus]|uniref:Uncharacterized protein LOC106524948 n=1 Tax=Austrofundulus limnaeus TaxID=52670 RepID=A0A2I4C392_AUSLI|nr:PREDICTED: uncharacterized protein LOC106524948 [Austrofundulus limnaeus]